MISTTPLLPGATTTMSSSAIAIPAPTARTEIESTVLPVNPERPRRRPEQANDEYDLRKVELHHLFYESPGGLPG